MKQFTKQSTAGVYRQTYSGSLSTFGQVSTTTGYLRSLDPETASKNGFQYGFAYVLVLEYGVDIRVGDKVKIGTKTYTVAGVNVNGQSNSSVSYTKAILTLPQ